MNKLPAKSKKILDIMDAVAAEYGSDCCDKVVISGSNPLYIVYQRGGSESVAVIRGTSLGSVTIEFPLTRFGVCDGQILSGDAQDRLKNYVLGVARAEEILTKITNALKF